MSTFFGALTIRPPSAAPPIVTNSRRVNQRADVPAGHREAAEHGADHDDTTDDDNHLNNEFAVGAASRAALGRSSTISTKLVRLGSERFSPRRFTKRLRTQLPLPRQRHAAGALRNCPCNHSIDNLAGSVIWCALGALPEKDGLALHARNSQPLQSAQGRGATPI